ncbi:hypothetical protein [Williamwhitmania taraxaci]|uniref:Uncharacterized protein n=1 Tax=Williamwhitmania taraxaci TaxID=1640674 RepID=A0A1G6I975_9BACT|nr:hypothetical protein [Williamwhitmania taraxaci]SDC03054.1 hypothetical protein SAMN05216323_101513 [Williamwhitmania taraxaci]
MDKSTIIYLIAIGLFILSKAFTKKKQQKEEPAEGSPFDAIFGGEQAAPRTTRSDPFEEIFESFGKAGPAQEEPAEQPSARMQNGYYSEEAYSEEQEYPSYSEQLLDTPATAAFTPIDTVEDSIYNPTKLSVENESNFEGELTAMTTFDADQKKREEAEMHEVSPYVTNFNLKYAMVYAEILKPKFQEI